MSQIGNVGPGGAPYAIWPQWLFPAFMDYGATFQERVYLFLSGTAYKFEQPAWLTQLILALVVWYSHNTAILFSLLACLISMVGYAGQTAPLSLMLAFLTGSLLGRGNYLIAIIPLLKMFVFDTIQEEYNETTNERIGAWHTLEFWMIVTGFSLFYRGWGRWFFQSFLITFFTIILLGQFILQS